MPNLKDNFKAVNVESGIVVTFERKDSVFVATWEDEGQGFKYEYLCQAVATFLASGLMFEVSSEETVGS